MSELRRTPLYERHVALGARMVPFAGFSMPVQYSSIKQEHAAVRESAALFDVSHMGQIHLRGPEAIATAERLLSCRVESLKPGRVRYGLLCNDEGGCVDDVTVYREAEDAIFLCVNAANIEKDWAWVQAHAGTGAGADNRSRQTALLALQGPHSAPLLGEILEPQSDAPAAPHLGRFTFGRYRQGSVEVLVSRTGYTGSDGFEIYLPADAAGGLFDALLDVGGDHGLAPAGLGARDTLRLEAALPLYGHELDDTTSPLEAGLGRFVKRKTGGFIGAESIEARERAGRARQLVGFQVLGRGIARADHPIVEGDKPVGRVTSGAPSPTLGTAIGLGYVPPRLAEPGTRLTVLVRERRVEAEVVTTPFIS